MRRDGLRNFELDSTTAASRSNDAAASTCRSASRRFARGMEAVCLRPEASTLMSVSDVSA